MNRITVKQIARDEIYLEDIRRIFFEAGIKTVADFRAKKASGELQVPSRDNLNALCKEKKGESFQTFFFGDAKKKFDIETNLIAHELTGSIKKPGSHTETTVPVEYAVFTEQTGFGNYAEHYLYKTSGQQKNSNNFSAEIFDENFINTLLEWCIDNKISTKNEYISKKPVYFPSPGNIRKLAGKADYLKEILNIDFKN